MVGIVFVTASGSAFITMRNLKAGAKTQPPVTSDTKAASLSDLKDVEAPKGDDQAATMEEGAQRS